MANHSFKHKVWRACTHVPRGRVTTYGALARAIRAPRTARAVGNALNVSPGMPSVPCHRVVRSDGRVGGFARGTRAKIALLEKEGVKIRNSRVEDFSRVLFTFSRVH